MARRLALGGSSPCESGMMQPPSDKATEAVLVAFCRELRVQFPRGLPAWNPGTRGAYDFGLPATRPLVAQIIELQAGSPSPPPNASHNAAPKDPNDIDEQAVHTMAAAVQELRAVSRHMFVLRDILNPALLLPVSQRSSPTGAMWPNGSLARTTSPCSISTTARSCASDFGDRTHLHPLAAERFSSLLAARMRPVVQETDDRASR